MSARSGKSLDSFVLVNKPKGITSFDVIRRLRRILKFRKMGHMGTLDPNATGLLPVCLGRATRLSRFLLRADKRYRATIRLGHATDTYDAEGKTVGEPSEPPELSDSEFEEILGRFRGRFSQRPPIYSAKKVAGKRLYQYAREGEKVELEPCEVTVRELKLLERGRDWFELDIASSSGMYVRSLAHDIGREIGCGAFLEELSRLAVGPLSLDNAYTLDAIEEMKNRGDDSFLQPMADLLPHFPAVEINAAQVERIRNGTPIILLSPVVESDRHVRLLGPQGAFIAVGLTKRPLGSRQMQVLPKVVLI